MLNPKRKRVRAEQTLMLVKPDGVLRGLAPTIFAFFEKRGFVVRECGPIWLGPRQADELVCSEPGWIRNAGTIAVEWSKNPIGIFGTTDPMKVGAYIRELTCLYLTTGLIIGAVLERRGAVRLARKLAGTTSPERAPRGTIRRNFGGRVSFNRSVAKGMPCLNVIHTSSPGHATREIQFFRVILARQRRRQPRRYTNPILVWWIYFLRKRGLIPPDD